MACRISPATAIFAIAIVLCTVAVAVAAAAPDEGPRWPSIYEPQWPDITGKTDSARKGDKRQVGPKHAPAPELGPPPQSIPSPSSDLTTGSVESPVAKRWPVAKAPQTIVVPAFEGELGLRYWMNFGETAKNLYNIPGTAMVSRLTYDGLVGHAVEAVGRIDHTSGFYAKGYVGIGIVNRGQLTDEDFPPFITPYSSTVSDQRDGTIAYASADIGFNLIRQPGFRLGAYAGYHYLDQSVSAYGCGQVGSNAVICGSQIPNDVLVITQSNHWNSLRVGLDATIRLGGPFSLSLDAAWLPYVKLNGGDSHWLRIGTAPGDFTGQIPEDGQGTGYQLEAALAYAVNQNVKVAIGGRYWRMETNGLTHFENHIVGVTALPQPVDWKVESYGVFVQGSFKFGPYPTGGVF
ncbi:MAG: omptin family outer membrane protease [Pseudomonadota bacterium]